MKWFRTRLREARERQALSQAELGKKFGVSGGAVSSWENGTEPRDEMRAQVEAWLEGEDKRADDEGVDQFSEWLRTSREHKGLSRAELAEKADVSQQTIYLIETGRVSNPWKNTRDQLTKALGVQPSSAVEEELREETETVFGSFSDFGPWDQSTIPEVACVYVYYDRTDRPVYVGETGNLQDRNRQHQENDKWCIRRLVDRGSYVETKTKEERKGLEKLLIQFLRRNTLFNRRHAVDEE
jgi:transcriptional regulator with XRE-family HTH domain